MSDKDEAGGAIIGFLFLIYLLVQLVKILITIAVVVGIAILVVKFLMWIYQVIVSSMEDRVREYALQKEQELRSRGFVGEPLGVKQLRFDERKEE